jgi:hypothetical protein
MLSRGGFGATHRATCSFLQIAHVVSFVSEVECTLRGNVRNFTRDAS